MLHLPLIAMFLTDFQWCFWVYLAWSEIRACWMFHIYASRWRAVVFVWIGIPFINFISHISQKKKNMSHINSAWNAVHADAWKGVIHRNFWKKFIRFSVFWLDWPLERVSRYSRLTRPWWPNQSCRKSCVPLIGWSFPVTVSWAASAGPRRASQPSIFPTVFGLLHNCPVVNASRFAPVNSSPPSRAASCFVPSAPGNATVGINLSLECSHPAHKLKIGSTIPDELPSISHLISDL